MLNRRVTILVAAIALLFVGAVAFLATQDIPAPTARVEKIIPDDRLPR